MANKKEGDQIKLLSKLIEQANESQNLGAQQTFGRCEWIDINGEERCNSPWSEFQCQQVSGTYTADASCE